MIEIGTEVRFRLHHPHNSWMDRWGPGTVESIDNGNVRVRSPRDGDRILPFPIAISDIYPVQHEIVPGESFGIATCMTCGWSLANHKNQNR